MYVAVLAEKGFELLVVNAPREVTDKKILHTVGNGHKALFNFKKVQFPGLPRDHKKASLTESGWHTL